MLKEEVIVSVIFAAVREGVLSPQQGMKSCLEFGHVVGEQPFDLEAFWGSQGWVSQAAFEKLLEEAQTQSGESQLPDLTQHEVWMETLNNVLITELSETRQPLPSGVEVPAVEKPKAWMSPTMAGDASPVAPSSVLVKVEHGSRWVPKTKAHERYDVEGELGRGGLGRVEKVRDLNLGRQVARKTLLKGAQATEQELAQFVAEACVTGQLEHPNIIPIYEIGMDHKQLYYTMRMIPSHSLADLLEDKDVSLVQAVKIIQQVCMGLEFAHARGVVHRDIKPANIMLGEFGEVLILDWGIAAVQDSDTLDMEHVPPVAATMNRTTKGTPLFMAPELVQFGQVTPSVDQFALGVILYRVLTGKLPFHHEHLFKLFVQICEEDPVPPRELCPERMIPEELEAICLRMLSKEPEERYPSCREVYNQLEGFLEGSKEREKRRLEAAACIEEAEREEEQFVASLAATTKLREAWEALQKQIDPWESMDRKRQLWQQEEEYKKAEQDEVRRLGRAVQKYMQALDREPNNAIARAGLARLYWNRFLAAEQNNDVKQQVYYLDLVMFYDDGHFQDLLEGEVSLSLSTTPPSATVELCRFEEQERRLVPLVVDTLQAPFSISLSPGSYLARIQQEGCQSMDVPLVLHRGVNSEHHVQMYHKSDVEESYVAIASGSFGFGGDVEAEMDLPHQEVALEDYFISRFPISFREYLEFLNAVHAEDPEQALELLPRSGQEVYVTLSEEGSYVPHRTTLFSGPIQKRYPASMNVEWNLPVLGVSWFDSILYCRWRSKQEGRRVTLPTEPQWEKAAVGMDGRIFPWGNLFDASFCKMGLSRPPQELQAEPIGTFEADVSPFGVRDMAGTISEWMLSFPQDEVDALDKDPKRTVIQRGGGWVTTSLKMMRARSRTPRPEGLRSYGCGFRVVTFPK